mgnify:CR=1 FL=1
MQWKKISSFNGIQTGDLCDTDAVLNNQLSIKPQLNIDKLGFLAQRKAFIVTTEGVYGWESKFVILAMTHWQLTMFEKTQQRIAVMI